MWLSKQSFFRPSLTPNFLVLVLMICISGGLSIFYGQDASFDLLNYHLYNALAFVQGRMNQDLAPAGIQTYLNPLVDLPYYFYITYFNDFPRLVAFLMGLYAGLAAFFL